MRKALPLLLVLLGGLLLAGCSEYEQVENLAYVVVVGLDAAEDNAVEMSVVIPEMPASRGGDSADGGSGSGNQVFSAVGQNFSEALQKLHWAVPRRLELSQIELIVVSERLAASPALIDMGAEVIDHLYGAAHIAVCSDSAKALLPSLTPQFGSSIQDELTAMFEDYTANGFIPDATFADYFYGSRSVYSDVLAIRAHTASSGQSAVPAALITPSDASTENGNSDSSHHFLGAAVFRNGLMAGSLDGNSYLLCKLLQGNRQTFVCSLNGESIRLSTLGAPNIQIETDASPLRIRIRLDLSILPNSASADEEALSSAIEEDLHGVIRLCKDMGVEPFGFAEIAAGQFLTLSDWLAYGWHDRFSESSIAIEVRLHSETG